MAKPNNSDILEIRVPFADLIVAEIDTPAERSRELDPVWAEALAFMIAAQGLIHPITVRLVDGRYRLVAGLHRLAAFKRLGWTTIPARISAATSDDAAKLEEVTENLGRKELTVLDRCHHLYDLKQVHERLYPETKNGGNRGNQHTGGRIQKLDSASTEVFGFAAATAEKIGMSRAAVFAAIKIWKDLTVGSRQRCVGTWLGNHQAGLKQLSEQTPAVQVKVLDLVLATPPRANTVADALTLLEQGRLLTHDERKAATARRALENLPEAVADTVVKPQLEARLAELQKSISTLSKFLGGLKDDELDQVVTEHEERIVASLKRRGRI